MTAYVERLTLRNWFGAILPRLIGQGRCPAACYPLEGSRLALAAARISGRWFGVTVAPFEFRVMDLRDARGLLVQSTIACEDLPDVQAQILRQPEFRQAVRGLPTESRLPTYLAKSLASFQWAARGTMSHALLAVRACAAHAAQARRSDGTHPIVFLDRRPWLAVFERYAARHGVTLIPVRASLDLNPRSVARRLLGPAGVEAARFLYQALRRTGSRARPSRPTGPVVAVEYYGHLNLDHPERYSNLFFWQQSSLSARDVVVLFGIPRDPLDRQKWAQLLAHGLTGLATHPDAAAIPEAPVAVRRPNLSRVPSELAVPSGMGNCERRWFREHETRYRLLRASWAARFAANRIKIYVSWYKYDATHCAIADALHSVGGVTAIYQQSYEPLPSVESTVAADVVFNFSTASAEVERQAGSVIPYHVATGYLGDHRFPLLRANARAIRGRLTRQGATRILGYADENSHGDARWYLGHQVQQEHYAFLLEKVLSEPWLGLVVKPKAPATLRRRLGNVAGLLTRAEATGRCLVLEGGALHSFSPPVEAALASDLMIHGHLWAGTAGVESALAGVPTLLLDREGWSVSPLYRLGVGRVVFTDWESLWTACLDHWKRSNGLPGFGDWSALLDELDPFRDGRAAWRMGTYLQWLLEGFKAGLSRDAILADAAARYAARWGKDKVTQVNWPRPDERPVIVPAGEPEKVMVS